MTGTTRWFSAFIMMALVLGAGTVTRADSGSRAQDIFGVFVGFQNGVCEVKVPGGKYKGTYDINIPPNIPVLVYTSPGHPQTRHSPDAFNGVEPGTKIEINIDSRQKVLRVCIGDAKPAKTTPSKS